MKHVKINKIKSLYSYTVLEIAKLTDHQPETIYRWISNEGLEDIDGQKPLMVFGQCLINFLKHRQQKNRVELKLFEIYCCKCHVPRIPIQSSISIHQKNKVYLYSGICPESHTKMNRIISSAQADILEEFLSSDTPFSRLTEHDNALANQLVEEWSMPPEYCCDNERIKWKYLHYEREVNGKSDKSIDKIVRAIYRFEKFTEFDVFENFNDEIAKAFKKDLFSKTNDKGVTLSLTTIASTLKATQNFLRWLAAQSKYKKHIDKLHIEYLNLKEKDKKNLRPDTIKNYPSMEEIDKVIFIATPSTEIQRRNQAILAFLVCTGIRIGALVGLKLKHFDPEKRLVTQDPADVATKFGKLIYTKFFPVREEIQQIVLDWYSYLKTEKGFGDESPLFPRTVVKHVGNFTVQRENLSHQHYSSPSSINGIVKSEFRKAGLYPYPPHRFRNTIAELGRKCCKNSLDAMAWGANLGHNNPITTFSVYGKITSTEQLQAMENLANPAEGEEVRLDNKELLRAFLQEMKEEGYVVTKHSGEH